MIIKKFVAKTEADATEDARRELGQGIVIMNVRPVKQEGFLSFLRPPRVEVTVALEDEPEDIPLSRNAGQTSSDRRMTDRYASQKTENRMRQVAPQAQIQQPQAQVKPREVSETERLLKASQQGTIPPLRTGQSTPENVQQPATAQVQRPMHVMQQRPEQTSPVTASAKPATPAESNVGVIEEKLDSLHSLLEERIGVSGKSDSTEQSRAGADQKTSDNAEMLTFVRLLYNTLIANEVDEIYANQLTDEVEKINKPNMPLEYMLANVYQKMVLKFGKSETIEQAPSGSKAVFFIGPTGVGKTTTIAKLASELYVMQHKKVALLTVDTYRIAAAEQLKTYASIMEIPCRVIYSPEEMRRAAEDLSDYDFLLIDTAGHSMHNEEQKKSIEAFLHAFDGVLPSEVFLVLSATTKYRDLIDITDSYTSMTKYRLLFTKMDETSLAGNLYNIKMHTDAPMSYITNGQNVPDDIAVFDAQSVVRGLLGGKKGLG
ncbi:MAG: flagellar biosynthesis protein FlhF [Lachnospiraceae bacterium]|nr:flagellar biosynthesis protein FlhF [Lachnospiraceae bacterium]